MEKHIKNGLKGEGFPDTLEEKFGTDDEKVKALVKKAKAFEDKGKFEEAEQIYDYGSKTFPTISSFSAYKAHLMKTLEKINEAEKCESQKRYRIAFNHYEKAYKVIKSKHILNKLYTLYSDGSMDKELMAGEEYLGFDVVPFYNKTLGILLVRAGEYSKAIKLLEPLYPPIDPIISGFEKYLLKAYEMVGESNKAKRIMLDDTN